MSEIEELKRAFEEFRREVGAAARAAAAVFREFREALPPIAPEAEDRIADLRLSIGEREQTIRRYESAIAAERERTAELESELADFRAARDGVADPNRPTWRETAERIVRVVEYETESAAIEAIEAIEAVLARTAAAAIDGKNREIAELRRQVEEIQRDREDLALAAEARATALVIDRLTTERDDAVAVIANLQSTIREGIEIERQRAESAAALGGDQLVPEGEFVVLAQFRDERGPRFVERATGIRAALTRARAEAERDGARWAEVAAVTRHFGGRE